MLQYYTGTVACKAVLVEAHRLGMRFSTDLLNGAAFSAELSRIQWLYTEHNCALSYETTLCCARAGHIEVLRWLKQQGAVFDARTMQAAATCDQRATCAYLHAEGCLGDELTMYEAAIAKHWDTVRWLHEHGCPWDFEHMCLTAAELDVLSAMLTLAGAYDHLAAAQWLRQR
eukprot:15541-Heterococcus_DN1.PRE.1